MSKISRGQDKVNGLKIIGTFLPKLPLITFKFGGLYLRIKSQSNKAGKKFEKELIKQGFDKQRAKELKNIYLKPANFKHYFNI
jgi:hypothetical protein